MRRHVSHRTIVYTTCKAVRERTIDAGFVRLRALRIYKEGKEVEKRVTFFRPDLDKLNTVLRYSMRRGKATDR